MANALVLTASSLGRTSQPGAGGAVLYVDGDNSVTIDAWPQPSRWVPEGVRLFRGDQDVGGPLPDDELRWVLAGDARFGEFRAVAEAGDARVESAVMIVLPAPSLVAQSVAPGAAGAIGTGSGAPSAGIGAAAPAAASPAGGSGRSSSAADASAGAPPRFPDTRPPTGTPFPASAGEAPTGQRLPAHARPEDIAALVEVPQGEYDGRFAAWVGAAFVLLTGVVLWFASTRLLGDPDLFATSTPAAEAVPADGPAPFVRSGNVADRIGLGTSTLVLAIGLVLLLAAAALAALEVRGRMLRRDRSAAAGAAPGPTGPPATGHVARGTAGALRRVAVIVDRISQPRAVIAVLVAGGALVAIGFIGQLHWAIQL